jgi:hypothetical protein
MKSLTRLTQPAIAALPQSNLRLGGWLTLGLSLVSIVLSPPHRVEAKPQSSPAAVRLETMFSPEMQVLNRACQQQGGVNLAAGADKDGSVICGNGWRKSPAQYAVYLDFATQWLAAGFLAGLQAGLQSNPGLKLESAAAFLNSPEVVKTLREAVRTGIISSEMLAKGSPQSVTLLTERVMQQVNPFLREPVRLNTLFGTEEEYSRIAQNFCKPSGMSIAQATRLVPSLLPVQVYAICLQEAGVVEEFKQGGQPKSQSKSQLNLR